VSRLLDHEEPAVRRERQPRGLREAGRYRDILEAVRNRGWRRRRQAHEYEKRRKDAAQVHDRAYAKHTICGQFSVVVGQMRARAVARAPYLGKKRATWGVREIRCCTRVSARACEPDAQGIIKDACLFGTRTPAHLHVRYDVGMQSARSAVESRRLSAMNVSV